MFAVLVPATVLVYVPARIVTATGDAPALAGFRALAVVPFLGGFAMFLACVAAFILEGRGTPAPYDPPRRLVTGVRYARVRNPMYVGVLAMLAGEAILYACWVLAAWSVAAWATFHLFVVAYEEPGPRSLWRDVPGVSAARAALDPARVTKLRVATQSGGAPSAPE